jgi:pumilio family protein 6
MKSLKGHMMEVAKSEHGHLILLALFDAVDDTVLLKKVGLMFRKFPHCHIY